VGSSPTRPTARYAWRNDLTSVFAGRTDLVGDRDGPFLPLSTQCVDNVWAEAATTRLSRVFLRGFLALSPVRAVVLLGSLQPAGYIGCSDAADHEAHQGEVLPLILRYSRVQILDSDQLQAAFGAVLAQPLPCGSRRLLGRAHGG
jgi:hypothetical protein